MANIISKDSVPYRIWDKVNGVWNQLNFRTNAKSVLADDGKNMQTKVGAISGITSDLNGESENIAASIKAVNQLNNNLTFPDGKKFYPDIRNGKRGYNTDPARGADTFVPFRQAITPRYIGCVRNSTFTFNEPYDRVIAFRSYDSRLSHYTPICNGIGSVELTSNPEQGIGVVNHTVYILSDIGVRATYRGYYDTNDMTLFFDLS